MGILRFLILLVFVVLVGVLGFWAGRVALEPPEDPLAEGPESVSYVVEVGSVGRALSFTATAEWDLVEAGLNSASGVVTSIDMEPGAIVAAGATLYTVNLRPVALAQGAVPMFRALELKSAGPDVGQLQALLSELGFYSGEVDGEFGSSTRTAVRAWQESLGLNSTGVVEAGDIVFLSELPARLTLDPGLTVGARLGGGEPLVLVVPDAPEFRISLAPEQAGLVPLSAQVFVTYPDGVWEAEITQAVERPEFGQLDLLLSGPDGSAVCGQECGDRVALEGRTSFRADIVVIPETTGPLLPVGAITTDPANDAWVTLVDGSTIPIEIVATTSGLAVVEGIDPGTEILLPVVEQ